MQYNYDAEYYDQGIGGFHEASFLPITQAFNDLVPLGRSENSAILDFGCGNGYYGEFLRTKATRVDAIDQSDVIFRSENRRYYDAIFKADLGVPLKLSQEYDVLYSIEVIEHIEDYRVYLQNAFNALRPQGYIFLTTTTYFWSLFIMLVVYRRTTSISALLDFSVGLLGDEKARTKFVVRFWDYFTGHYHGFTESQIRRGLECAGFDIVTIKSLHVQPVVPVRYLDQEYNGTFKPLVQILIPGLKLVGRAINAFCRLADVAAPNIIVIARKRA